MFRLKITSCVFGRMHVLNVAHWITLITYLVEVTRRYCQLFDCFLWQFVCFWMFLRYSCLSGSAVTCKYVI